MPTDGIEKIERDVISTKHNLVEGRSSLSTVLTQTRILAKKLDVDHQWITNELDGYNFENLAEAIEKLPKYRLVTIEFLDMYNRPIVIDNPTNDKLAENLTRHPLVTPITNFQGVHDGGVIIMRSGTPIELLHMFIEKGWIQQMMGLHELAGVSARISNQQLLVIYDKVKNLTIEFLSELEDKIKDVKLT